MKPAIRVENLGKRYRVNHAAPREKYRTLRDSLASAATAPLRRFRNGGQAGTTEDFWALKDVNFEVQPGEVVGIIGRNGAGKSTLLKVLSRITEPTQGQVRLNGRIASLLEVGTGFHPELTGRENIYLNGSILGMHRREIAQNFDAIVDFAGINAFLDTPVKRYSSGMYVRLAFAVAAHLEPEILIIDEVLAVGDSEFQRKCTGKMKEVASAGRTVLFVSHNMPAVQGLCSRGIVLVNGDTSFDGPAAAAVSAYIASAGSPQHSAVDGRFDLSSRRNTYGDGTLLVSGLSLRSCDGHHGTTYTMGSTLVITIDLEPTSHFRTIRPQVGVLIKSDGDQLLANFNTGMRPALGGDPYGSRTLTLTIPELPFVPGRYWLDISIGQKQVGRIDYVERAAPLDIADSDIYGSGYSPTSADGVVYINGEWAFGN